MIGPASFQSVQSARNAVGTRSDAGSLLQKTKRSGMLHVMSDSLTKTSRYAKICKGPNFREGVTEIYTASIQEPSPTFGRGRSTTATRNQGFAWTVRLQAMLIWGYLKTSSEPVCTRQGFIYCRGLYSYPHCGPTFLVWPWYHVPQIYLKMTLVFI